MDIEQIFNIICEKASVTKEDAIKLFEKAIEGGEISKGTKIETWLEERFLPNIVTIDKDGYAKMCVDALKILGGTAATDYGSSRQRDMGQLWADMTRGYLGEYAFIRFLYEKGGIEADLGHDSGQLGDFLPTDIHRIKKTGDAWREPKLTISIKTTKWNGIWLDIPGDQFNHSDVHVLIKVGAGRDHLFSFFKEISVFKDKVLKKGVDIGALTDTEADSIFEKIPSFMPISAYICGFVRKKTQYRNLSYTGQAGRKNYKIKSWNGPIRPGDLQSIKTNEAVSGTVKFEGIGEFAHDSGYLFNTGNLIWTEADWRDIFLKI